MPDAVQGEVGSILSVAQSQADVFADEADIGHLKGIFGRAGLSVYDRELASNHLGRLNRQSRLYPAR